MLIKPNILAIKPGGREFGIAVFQGQELLFYVVKTIKPHQHKRLSYQLITKLLNKLIVTYSINAIAIEQVPRFQSNASKINRLLEHLQQLAKEKEIFLFLYERKVIRNFVAQNERGTKQEVARKISLAYPELTQFIEAKKNWRDLYYGKLFSAVAVGVMCYRQLQANQARNS